MTQHAFTTIEPDASYAELRDARASHADVDAAPALTFATALAVFIGRAEACEEVEVARVSKQTGAGSVAEIVRSKISLLLNLREIKQALDALAARGAEAGGGFNSSQEASPAHVLEFSTRYFGRIALVNGLFRGRQDDLRRDALALVEEEAYSMLFCPLAVGRDVRLVVATQADETSLSFASEISRQLHLIMRRLVKAPLEQTVSGIKWYGDADSRASGAASLTNRRSSRAVPLFLEQFMARVAQCPDSPAVEESGRALTYADLHKRTSNLARILRRAGVKSGDFVGLCLPRGSDLVLVMLGVLKAGAAFVPLDISSPPGRLEAMGADAGLKYVLLDGAEAPTFLHAAIKSIALGDCRDEIENGDAEFEVTPLESESHAYAFFTSGSTGAPKAAAVSHHSLARYVESIGEHLRLEGRDRVLQIAPPAFDVIVEEVFPTLAAGACLVIPPETPSHVSHDLSALVGDLRLTVIELTTAYWHRWVEHLRSRGERPPASLRLVLIGGEHVSPRIFAEWLRFGVELLHVYGTTETTCTSTVFHPPEGITGLHPLWRGLPIGKPLDFCSVCVLDAEGSPVPPLLLGELCILGDGVGSGYLNRPELTRQKFVTHHACSAEGARLYRTGDFGRLLPDGNLEFFARRDAQVKVRGYRVELREVEHALQTHPDVKEVSVLALAHPTKPEMLSLGALVSVRGASVDAGSLRAFLRTRLPEFMIPAHVAIVDELPMLPNGKVDQRRTRELLSYEPPCAEPQADNDVGRVVAATLTEVLGRSGFTSDDPFFEIGMDSLTLMEMSVRLSERLGQVITDLEIYMNPTVGRLAEFIESRSAAAE